MQRLDQEIVELLAEIAFVAGDSGLVSQVDTIAEGLQAARPDSEHPFVIQAYARLGARDPAGAEDILRRRALPLAPDSDGVNTILGLALHMAGKRAERDRVLAPLAAAGSDIPTGEIATRLLQAG